jgi:cold shock CspA family protein
MNTPTRTAAARLAARLLAHRRTPTDEVGAFIRNVHDALARLAELPEAAAERLETQELAAQAPALRRRRQPRRETTPPPAAVSEAPALPAPKLVRRADMAPAAPAAPLMVAPAPPHGALRGVVRWFDPKSGKGALRLPGLGDVGFEARLLTESGITRLFKGQEIEATLAAGNNGAPQLQRLSVPGAVSANPLGGGVVKGRHAKPVVVELKREALRRAAARAEAEQVLGTTRTR